MDIDEVQEKEQGTAMVAFQSNALLRAEIDTQIATAKAFPRSLRTFKDKAHQMATLDKETAKSCTYAKPVGDGKIATGPSARFAEIVAVAWKNLRFGGRVCEDSGDFIKAQGVAYDLENNIQVTIEESRSVMTSAKNNMKPRRFSNSQVAVVGSATTSIAIRNAILKVVPKAYWKPIHEASIKAAVGDTATFAQSRKEWLDYFTKKGVKIEAILATLEKNGIEDVDLDDLATLMGLANAIKEGEVTLQEAFAPPQTSTATAAKEKLAPKSDKPNGTSAPEAPEEKKSKPITKAQTKAIDELLKELVLPQEEVESVLGGDVAALTEAMADDVRNKLLKIKAGQSAE